MSDTANKTWPIEGPLDLRLSLRFTLPTPWLDADDRSAVYALRTGAGPATVRLRIDARRLVASATGTGAHDAIAAVPRTVGLDDDPRAFDPPPGPVRDLHRTHRGMRLGSTGRVFDTILPTVIGQRVTTGEAKRSYRRIVQSLGEPAPGEPGLLLPPTARTVAGLSFDDLRSFGIERARARVVIEVANRASRLEEIEEMDRDRARDRLLAVAGVGPWTAAQVMGAAWGDRDAIPMGDFHLPNTVSWLLAGEPRADDERMVELLEPYRPYRRRAMLLIKLSGSHAPRYGPRSPQSIISRGGRF